MCPKLLAGLMSIGIIAAPIRSPANVPDPVAPPMGQASADCGHPTYATDHLVCSNTELAVLDGTVADMIADLPARPRGVGPSWLEEQEAWFKRRSMCAFEANHVECTREAYHTRIAELGALASRSDGGMALRCSLLPDVVQYARRSDGLIVLRNREGAVLLLAWPDKHRGWRPFVAYRWKKAKLRLARLGNDADLTCR